MKIFFDYQIFYFQKYGGISKRLTKLSENLKKIKNKINRDEVNEYYSVRNVFFY